jgi:hypothetical protein
VVRLHRRFGLRLALDCLLCRGLPRNGLGGVFVLCEQRSGYGEQTAAECAAKQATIQTIQRTGPPAVADDSLYSIPTSGGSGRRQ